MRAKVLSVVVIVGLCIYANIVIWIYWPVAEDPVSGMEGTALVLALMFSMVGTVVVAVEIIRWLLDK